MLDRERGWTRLSLHRDSRNLFTVLPRDDTSGKGRSSGNPSSVVDGFERIPVVAVAENRHSWHWGCRWGLHRGIRRKSAPSGCVLVRVSSWLQDMVHVRACALQQRFLRRLFLYELLKSLLQEPKPTRQQTNPQRTGNAALKVRTYIKACVERTNPRAEKFGIYSIFVKY